jgi:hypothetical protein
MYRPLVPCPSCQRHIAAVESVCPFCAAALPDNLAAAIVPGATQRLTRAAAFVFTASLTVTGCGTDVTGSGSTAGTTGDATSSGTGAGGNAADGGPIDDGGSVALYGAPEPDGGPDDDGGSMAEYGAPADAG